MASRSGRDYQGQVARYRTVRAEIVGLYAGLAAEHVILGRPFPPDKNQPPCGAEGDFADAWELLMTVPVRGASFVGDDAYDRVDDRLRRRALRLMAQHQMAVQRLARALLEDDTLPGRLRYETLKRAGFRCELCGVSAEERALDVDHILPKSRGGPDTPENLQALCWRCNADKGAGDDLDLRSLKGLYSRRESGCIFCEVPRQRVLAENSLAYAVWDAHAVVHGHALVIPKRHVPDYFDLVPGEDKAVQVLLREMRAAIRRDDVTVEGFNVGVNSGAVAGQTIFHCHVHLFPRRLGDVANPRGGVRHTIPGRGDY